MLFVLVEGVNNILKGIRRKIIIIFSVCLLIVLTIILAYDLLTPGQILLPTKVIRVLSNVEELREFILQYEFFAPLIFFILQIVQVIISPIPGNVTMIIGGNLFGAFYGLILNTMSIYIGSIIAFYLGRRFGKPLVVRLIGEGIYEKYNKIFEEKYLISLFMIFLFPMFPDDALCLLTGISSVPTRIFLILLIVGRFPSILVSTLMGSGLFELTVRAGIIIGILFLLGFIISIAYGRQIEIWLYSKVFKKKEKQ